MLKYNKLNSTNNNPININPFATGKRPVCGWRFKPVDNITVYVENREIISLRFSSNSEASASELQESLEEMFFRYAYSIVYEAWTTY